MALLDLVEAAYGGLPRHHLPKTTSPFRIDLQCVPGLGVPYVDEPPSVRMQWGERLVCGVMDASNYVIVSPHQHYALVVASEDMLSFPYHLRYELIEFAVYILTTRGLGLTPLHGACVGRAGRGVLLLGGSGAGKSTLALHSFLQGLDFVAEDAVLVQSDNLLATGVANYLHVTEDALHFIEDKEAECWIREAPTIRRRSGVQKFEADLRYGPGKSADAPLQLVATVFLSRQVADDPGALLRPIPKYDIAAKLSADQPYAASLPGWSCFQQQLVKMGAYELRRGNHPIAAVEALRQLLR
ncbi:hypothetical protein GCM10011408_25620 [Dyella caseinilytica]|nr:hypothetical protein GCM10011408_25620 [Dyella caseinilytica]